MTYKLDSIGWEVVVAYWRRSVGATEYNRINPVNIAPMTTESQTTVLTCSLVMLRQEVRPASHLMPTYTPDMGREMATGSWTKCELAWIPHIRCRTKTAT